MFSFTKHRFKFYIVAVVLLALSLLSPLLVPRMNMGIDITGGIQVEYAVTGGSVDTIIAEKDAIIQNVRAALDAESREIISDTPMYGVTGTDHFIVEAGIDESGLSSKTTEERSIAVEKAKSSFVTALEQEFAKKTDQTITQARYINIGASFGAYIKQSGYLTLTLAIIAIAIYIQYAFRGSIAGMASWPFAVVTGASLFHDVIIAFGLYVLTGVFFPEFKIDTFFITAMLTILGYSINDSIVVMDRIRSNLLDGSSKKLTLAQVIDNSIHDTMRRSIFTSFTIFVVLVSMFFFGPESLKGFSLALIFGTVVGTYSSVCIASPMLLDITNKKR